MAFNPSFVVFQNFTIGFYALSVFFSFVYGLVVVVEAAIILNWMKIRHTCNRIKHHRYYSFHIFNSLQYSISIYLNLIFFHIIKSFISVHIRFFYYNKFIYKITQSILILNDVDFSKLNHKQWEKYKISFYLWKLKYFLG